MAANSRGDAARGTVMPSTATHLTARRVAPAPDTLTLAGYGVRLSIERGHLLITDGIGASRRTIRLPRVSGLKRVMVLGHAGTVSLEALRWLRDVGAIFVQMDADASLVAVGVPTNAGDVRVRRGQALALGTRTGVEVARALLLAKVKGQGDVLRRIPQRAKPARPSSTRRHRSTMRRPSLNFATSSPARLPPTGKRGKMSARVSRRVKRNEFPNTGFVSGRVARS